MKKCLTLLLLTLCSLSIFAQQGFEIGLDLMPQTYWIMNGTDFDRGDQLDHVPSFGLALGVHAGYNFSDNVGLQIGALYSAQGQKYEAKSSNSAIPDIEYAQKLTYLKIPVLFKFNGDPDNSSYFIGMIGPQFGILTKFEQEGAVPGTLRLATEKDAYNGVDIGGALAVGAGFNLSDAVNLSVLLRFDGSFGDIENKDDFWQEVTHVGREKSSNVTGGVMVSLNYVMN